jgi:hypothetical protein
MNATVEAFVQALRKLSPGDRLAALDDYQGIAHELEAEAIGQVQRNERAAVAKTDLHK